MNQQPEICRADDNRPGSVARWSLLAFACLLIAAVWLQGLPRLAVWRPLQQHIQTMQAAEIEVDAMFYTELKWYPGR